jgi:glycosyltransferase involved in cell wall biosynthesis
MSKIKVVNIIHDLHGGGAERFAVDLAKFLDRDKFAVEVICLRDEGNWKKELEALGISVQVLGGIRGFSFLSFGKLLKAVKKAAPNIVHTHLFWGDFFGRLAAKLAGVKAIISTEQNLNLSEGFLKRTGKIATARFARAIIAVSEAVKKYAIKYEGAKEKQLEIIPNGLEIEKFLNTERNYDNGGRELVVGSIGRLAEQKGFDCLIKALVDVKSVKCLIAGEGEKRKELQGLIDQLGLGEKVKLVGWQENIKKFLAGLDIFVLPSRWEGLGIVILEAGLSGLPVVASRVDGILDIISDGQDGLFFTAGNEGELAAQIKRLQADPGERERLGKRLQEKIREKFDIKKIAKRYEAVYLEALGK